MGIEEIRRIREDRDKPKEKKVYRLNKVSPKTLERKAKQEETVESGKSLVSGGAKLKRWFEERRKELSGRCAHCGGRSCKDSDEYYKFSIAHILPKRIFKSVATHESNYIELCFWNNSCHTRMDDNTLDMTEMHCWDTIVERFVKIYPFIDKKERRHIPDIFLNYIHTDI